MTATCPETWTRPPSICTSSPGLTWRGSLGNCGVVLQPSLRVLQVFIETFLRILRAWRGDFGVGINAAQALDDVAGIGLLQHPAIEADNGRRNIIPAHRLHDQRRQLDSFEPLRIINGPVFQDDIEILGQGAAQRALVPLAVHQGLGFLAQFSIKVFGQTVLVIAFAQFGRQFLRVAELVRLEPRSAGAAAKFNPGAQ